MNETVTYVTQSKFFSPAFNAAIFDGPIKIYFAQSQESQALKLYHNLQERFAEVRRHAQRVHDVRGSNIFVMLYPTEETFEHCFGSRSSADREPEPVIMRERFGTDYVVGVAGLLEDDACESVCRAMNQIVTGGDA